MNRALGRHHGERLLRKEGDSNPRYGNPYVSLANWWFQPLTHPSWGFKFPLTEHCSQMRCKGTNYFRNLQTFSILFLNIFNASAACSLQLAKFHRVVLNLFLTSPLGDLHCQSSASDTYAPKAYLQAEMTIDGIVEGISAKFMTDSARIMITSA